MNTTGMRWMAIVLGLSFAVAVLTFGLSASSDVEAGKDIFMNRCKMCHGEDGNGNASMAKILQVEFKPMDSEYIQKKSDAEFKEIITKGKGKMAAVRGLTEAQLDDVIAYVRSLAKHTN